MKEGQPKPYIPFESEVHPTFNPVQEQRIYLRALGFLSSEIAEMTDTSLSTIEDYFSEKLPNKMSSHDSYHASVEAISQLLTSGRLQIKALPKDFSLTLREQSIAKRIICKQNYRDISASEKTSFSNITTQISNLGKKMGTMRNNKYSIFTLLTAVALSEINGNSRHRKK